MEKTNFIYGDEKKFYDFMGNLIDKDRIAILSHKDLDGIISALAIEKLVGKAEVIEFLSYSKNMLFDFISKFKKKKINKAIFLDICLEAEEENLKEISKFSEILIIDHHKWNKNMNSDRISFLLSEQKDCPSFVSYMLVNKSQNIEDIDFLAAIAVISDYVSGFHKDFIEKIEKKYNLKRDKDDFNSDLGKMMAILSNSQTYFANDKKNKFYNLIKGIKKLEDIQKFKKYSLEVEKELDRIREDFNKNKEEYSWGYYFVFEKKFAVSSLISSSLSMENPNKLYITLSDSISKENQMDVNARNQSQKYNCSDVLKKAVLGLENGNAGGHVPAAGGQIMKKDMGKFKQKLLGVLGK